MEIITDNPAFEPFLPRLRKDALLSKTNWFQVGGSADWLFKPSDTQDLSAFLKLLPPDVAVTVLGVGSNVIVRDGGIRGVVIKLGRGFTGIEIEKDHVVAGAGALDVHVAQVAGEHSIAGLEFLAGIPGTIGGAVRMNAGAYGSDMAQVFDGAEWVLRDGSIIRSRDIGFAYRKSSLPDDAIVTSVWLRAFKGNQEEILARMAHITTSREESQPIRMRTGGSTFKNPEGHKAWELIDKAGCRGLIRGGAQVSEKHCNFLINVNNATASDLEQLGDEVIARVKKVTGITLQWEIKRIGQA